mmetsp:Transcript_125942/g.403233  ORF Transcript_125942/g.403233 Transcript_125942/m.403233 type:complete len:99 (+) Transcript_125942:247-543(+)
MRITQQKALSPALRRMSTTDLKANHSGISSPARRSRRNSVPESFAASCGCREGALLERTLSTVGLLALALGDAFLDIPILRADVDHVLVVRHSHAEFR